MKALCCTGLTVARLIRGEKISHLHHIFSDTKRLWAWKSSFRAYFCFFFVFFSRCKSPVWHFHSSVVSYGNWMHVHLPSVSSISSECCQLSGVIILRLMTHFPVWSKVKARISFLLISVNKITHGSRWKGLWSPDCLVRAWHGMNNTSGLQVNTA